MQAWQMTGIGEPIRLVELPDPVPGTGEIVLRPMAAGLCHTDVGLLDGTINILPHLPMVLGHEIAGVIEAIGEGVEDYAVGDRVVVMPGREAPGSGCDGGYATRVRCATKFLIPIPNGVSFEDAAVSTDACATSYHAVAGVAGVKPGDRVGIIGAGGLGHVAIQIAAALGAKVFVAEIRAEAQQACAALPVERWALSVKDFADEQLDAIIDFAGFGVTTAEAIESVKEGGLVVIVGVGVNQATIPTLTLIRNQVTLKGCRAASAEHTEAALRLVAEGRLKPHIDLIEFAQIGEGLDRLRDGGVLGRLVAAPPAR